MMERNYQYKFGVLLFHAFYNQNNIPKQRHPYLYVSKKDFEIIVELFLEGGIRFIDPLKFGTPEQQDDDGLWCLLTFDDGYVNNFHALDVLEKYDVKVLLYCVKEQIEKQELFWWDVFYKHRIREVSFDTLYAEIQELKKQRAEEVRRMLTERYGNEAFNIANDDEGIRPLTTQELRQLSGHPLVEIGVHSNSHKILTNCHDGEIREEISCCKSFLEEVTGKVMLHLSYPNGNYNEKIISMADQLGLQTAVTVRRGLNALAAGADRKSWLELYRAPLPSPGFGTSIVEQAGDLLRAWKKEYAESRHTDS